MTETLIIDQYDKFDGKGNSKINQYNVFSNKTEIPSSVKLQLKLDDRFYTWYRIGTLRKEQLEKFPFIDLSICDKWEMIPIDNKEQIQQVKQLL